MQTIKKAMVAIKNVFNKKTTAPKSKPKQTPIRKGVNRVKQTFKSAIKTVKNMFKTKPKGTAKKKGKR